MSKVRVTDVLAQLILEFEFEFEIDRVTSKRVIFYNPQRPMFSFELISGLHKDKPDTDVSLFYRIYGGPSNSEYETGADSRYDLTAPDGVGKLKRGILKLVSEFMFVPPEYIT